MEILKKGKLQSCSKDYFDQRSMWWFGGYKVHSSAKGSRLGEGDYGNKPSVYLGMSQYPGH